jgi:hypothetical protein
MQARHKETQHGSKYASPDADLIGNLEAIEKTRATMPIIKGSLANDWAADQNKKAVRASTSG